MSSNYMYKEGIMPGTHLMTIHFIDRIILKNADLSHHIEVTSSSSPI